ncbi:MAG: signal peptide peptidase SppA [Candidatus Aminicenantes bacterium]|nr:signal peptide peptidase SppA [Candidatus Aminicenantes bacterium]
MKRKSVWLILIFFFIFLTALAFVSVFVSNLTQEKVRITSDSYLEINLNGQLEEYSPTMPFMQYFQGPIISLYDTWMNLRKAALDPRIKAVVLKFGILDSDWAKIEELRQAVINFRKSGKPIIAYFEESPEADKEYYLATACNKIILHPLGWLGINGFATYVPFFKGLLDRLGIKAEFEHIEEYKTAYNQFTENGFTPAHQEMLESIYHDIFDRYLKEIASARHKSQEEMRSLLDRGYFQGKEALDAHLVDGLAYEDQLLEILNLKDVKELTKVDNSRYARLEPSSLGLNIGRKVALIYATGTILSGEEEVVALGSQTFIRWLQSATRDKTIAAIIVRIDSPGGSAVGADTIWHELIKARREKPVIISMSGLAGSGGYWMALGGNRIIAQPQTLTGSIGVIAGKFSFEGLMKKLGINIEKVVIGKEADAFTIYREFTPEERKILKDQIKDIYEQFLQRVASARNISTEEANRLGRGRVWTGNQAKNLNLIDDLGGLDLAIDSAKQLAGISPKEEVELVVWPKKRSFLDILMGRKAEITSFLAENELIAHLVHLIKSFSRPATWALTPFWLY